MRKGVKDRRNEGPWKEGSKVKEGITAVVGGSEQGTK